ncbi:PAK4-inhibitor INKA2-like isoform X1 [Triplophysa dalaica]|uniref:PAK4-inhibitor INKA2-like isoform X1 n=2 Tax=Triplophysa dalaica TaxID=1582913 RepID=UPI0024DFBA3E|nr:PAK4-inhibitor INKA2-like isoform X1 [Triplophysa dalaica]
MDRSRRNMDTCLRKLKQELLSMKDAGDGLHAQMNSMMGALQELKLLQVQTALEQLDISGNTVCLTQGAVQSSSTIPNLDNQTPQSIRTFILEDQDPSQHPQCNRLGTSSSSSSLESESTLLPRRISGYTAPQVEYCGPKLGQLPVPYTSNQQDLSVPKQQAPPANEVDLPGILHSLSREGPSLDSKYGEDSMDDSSDWTSSLMSQSRNRQPLVLGDNIFADLVGNWLDLPELEKDLNRPDSPAHPLRLTRSQELCQRFSLTTNIFKKFLRGVRPDRDKLLKEKPGWMSPDHNPETELFKRPKKATKCRGGFYLPFWTVGQMGKVQSCPQPTEERGQFLELNIDSLTDPVDKVNPLFDYNTAVWV